VVLANMKLEKDLILSYAGQIIVICQSTLDSYSISMDIMMCFISLITILVILICPSSNGILSVSTVDCLGRSVVILF